MPFFFWTDKSRQSFLTADETEAKLLPVDKKVCHQLGRKLMLPIFRKGASQIGPSWGLGVASLSFTARRI